VPSLTEADPGTAFADEAALEACRSVALRLRAQLEWSNCRSVAVVSAMRDEGKTTVACNLAMAMASLSKGREVALVDLDLRKPNIGTILGLPPTPGTDHILTGEATLEDVRIEVGRPALDIYPARQPRSATHELLVQARFAEMIRALEDRYAMVIVDTPPGLALADTSLILKHVARCIPVARTGISRARSFRKLIEALPREQIVGSILNGTRLDRAHYDYYSADAREEIEDR
jgi:capsular exopolysaccharide synthesis family protein